MKKLAILGIQMLFGVWPGAALAQSSASTQATQDAQAAAPVAEPLILNG